MGLKIANVPFVYENYPVIITKIVMATTIENPPIKENFVLSTILVGMHKIKKFGNVQFST